MHDFLEGLLGVESAGVGECVVGGGLGNVGGLFWDFGDRSRMILQDLGCYSSPVFQERNHGRSTSSARKLAENPKVWVRSGKGGGPEGPREDGGAAQALALAVIIYLPSLLAVAPASPPSAERTLD